MKKISYYILAMGVGMMALTGCNDSFLDTSSKTSSNSTSFYKTQEQANYAVIGCATICTSVRFPMAVGPHSSKQWRR